LIKHDAAPLRPHIKLILLQLKSKLSVEKRYKDGVEKMIKLYKMEDDRKSKGVAEVRWTESNQKIQLLTRALRNYEELHGDVQNSTDVADHVSVETLSQRRTLTGHLSVKIHAVAEVEHAASRRTARGPDRFVVMTVGHAIKGRTKATKTDRWTDEQHEFGVDKANEIEFTVYEKSSGNSPLLIGLVWINLPDLVDETRRKKVESEFSQAGRTTADKMDGSQPRTRLQFQPPPNVSDGAGSANGATVAATRGSTGSGQPSHSQTGAININAWFSLEPVGSIQLTLGFAEYAKDCRTFYIGLNRKGAVRQKKDNMVERYGHKFTPQTFHNIMRCALCGDLLRYIAGMQCIDCKYTCHRKCYQKVVTKCISKTNAEIDTEEEGINHRIPHRFEEFSNMGASWCCHCGYMLPFSGRQSRKCTECKLTCHTNCMHFVPDFCGMIMSRANKILAEIKETKTSCMLQNNHKLQSHPHSTSGRPTLPVQDPIVLPIRTCQDVVSQIQTNQGLNRFLHDKERLSDLYEQPPHKPLFGTSSAQNQQQPLHDTTTPVVIRRKEVTTVNTATIGSRIGLDHFNFLAVLGKGNFGKVMLAETKITKQLYAIKMLKKESIIQNNEVESIHSEKRVFLIAKKERHPFLYSLHACFQTETRIYFVLEYISGGDLMLHIQRGQFGIKRTQFYAAEVCLALKYFHENGVIYRDLKLDNILLTLDGHIKLADFGLCKENMWFGSTTSTFCGTPEFMAPEIVLEKEYGRAVDWWAFGVLIYQMLLQQSPYRGEDEGEIYDAILTDEPLYPIYMPQDSVSILRKLLTRQPELRLGSGPTDAQEIMSHAFFRNVNWDDAYHKRIPVPYLPTVTSREDISNFDSEFTSAMPVLTPVQTGK
jgi:classical protein kinase C/novel protein kinase C epsilon type